MLQNEPLGNALKQTEDLGRNSKNQVGLGCTFLCLRYVRWRTDAFYWICHYLSNLTEENFLMTVIDNVDTYKQTAENNLIHFYARLQTKVHDAENVTQEVADKTRKAAVYGVLWLFI